LLGILPFCAYFLGVIIRTTTFPAQKSLKLWQQLLIAIPLSILIVAPLIKILGNAISDDWPGYLLTIGIIIEHGMFMNEALATKIEEHRSGSKESVSQTSGG
jgi:uncharacterized membrane protein